MHFPIIDPATILKVCTRASLPHHDKSVFEFPIIIILFTLISRFYQRPITINNNDISFIAPINPCTIITILPIFFYIKSCIKKTNLIINMPERKTCRPTAYHKYISVIRYSTCRGAALINSSSSSARVKYYNIRTRASGWTRKRKSFSCYFCSTYLCYLC